MRKIKKDSIVKFLFTLAGIAVIIVIAIYIRNT